MSSACSHKASRPFLSLYSIHLLPVSHRPYLCHTPPYWGWRWHQDVAGGTRDLIRWHVDPPGNTSRFWAAHCRLRCAYVLGFCDAMGYSPHSCIYLIQILLPTSFSLCLSKSYSSFKGSSYVLSSLRAFPKPNCIDVKHPRFTQA